MFWAGDDSDGNVAAIARREWLLRWGARALGLVTALAIGWAFVRGGTRIYERHLANQARQACSQGKWQEATATARRALQLNPDDAKSCRVLAEAAEAEGKPEAVTWRLQLSRLEPENLDDQFALAAAALHFDQSDLAGKILATIPMTARDCAHYHALRGALAVAEQQLTAADGHYAVALRMEPANMENELNLAVLRINSPDEKRAAWARDTLVRLVTQPPVRARALRALAGDALTRNMRAQAEKWTTLLCHEKDASLADALLQLDAMASSANASEKLASLQERAAHSARDAGELINWLNRHGRAAEVLSWLPRLPAPVTQTFPVPLAVAESYRLLQDWRVLESWISEKNWGAYECVRLALESQIVRSRREAGDAEIKAAALWQAALRMASDHPRRLAMIAQLAADWSDDARCEEAWWLIANSRQNPNVALAALSEHYKSQQNSYGLLRVARRAFELNPTDDYAAANCANLGLLLNGDGPAARIAQDNYLKNPDDPGAAATYAFALHVQNKTAAGLKILNALRPDQQQQPAVAAYYFILLVKNGELERAQAILPFAQKAALLPEQQKLVAEAAREVMQWETENARSLAHS